MRVSPPTYDGDGEEKPQKLKTAVCCQVCDLDKCTRQARLCVPQPMQQVDRGYPDQRGVW
jgi:hypothetical protein